MRARRYGRSGGRALVGRAVPVGAGASRPEQPARVLRLAPDALRCSTKTGCEARSDRGPEMRCSVVSCGRDGRFRSPFARRYGNAEGRRLHLLRFRSGPGKTGARDRYGHPLTGLGGGEQALLGRRGLHVEEKAAAARVGFRAPRGAGWT